MIPLCLVTGFLGGGKTTLLERLWRRYQGRRLAFIINEFSSFAVDPLRFPEMSGSIICIPGGSIFCRCKVTELIGALGGIAAGVYPSENQVEAVVVEASGIANPKGIVDLLRDTRLDRQFGLASVVSMVDPSSFLKLLETLPALRDQIEASNVALINKIDLHEESVLADVEMKLRSINRNLIVQRVQYADANLDLFTPFGGVEAIHGDYAECRDPRFFTYAAVIDTVVDLEWIRFMLLESASFLYRAKGVLNGCDGASFVDYSIGSWNVRPVPGDILTRGLVLIGDSDARIKDLARRIRTGKEGF